MRKNWKWCFAKNWKWSFSEKIKISSWRKRLRPTEQTQHQDWGVKLFMGWPGNSPDSPDRNIWSQMKHLQGLGRYHPRLPCFCGSLCLSSYLSECLFVLSSVRLSFCPSVYLSIRLSLFRLSACLSFFIFFLLLFIHIVCDDLIFLIALNFYGLRRSSCSPEYKIQITLYFLF